jgi:hypothetical protein
MTETWETSQVTYHRPRPGSLCTLRRPQIHQDRQPRPTWPHRQGVTHTKPPHVPRRDSVPLRLKAMLEMPYAITSPEQTQLLLTWAWNRCLTPRLSDVKVNGAEGRQRKRDRTLDLVANGGARAPETLSQVSRTENSSFQGTRAELPATRHTAKPSSASEPSPEVRAGSAIRTLFVGEAVAGAVGASSLPSPVHSFCDYFCETQSSFVNCSPGAVDTPVRWEFCS